MDHIQALAFHKLGEDASLLNELVVGAVFDESPTFKNENAVAVFNGGQRVGDDDTVSVQTVQ